MADSRNSSQRKLFAIIRLVNIEIGVDPDLIGVDFSLPLMWTLLDDFQISVELSETAVLDLVFGALVEVDERAEDFFGVVAPHNSDL